MVKSKYGVYEPEQVVEPKVEKQPEVKDERKARYIKLAERGNANLTPVERTERDALAAEYPETAEEYKDK